ncbi:MULTISPECIES: TetR/AcrR family transcriptional regulator [unclassified Micromonospora]|uniref:TetR/AcrR family transcriptional regulator n=1 Tax=unclassified Micromonospora TaxID=2617518 RepID=UPI001C20FB3D|nr:MULTISPECIES: TetR/AcrR family transcriptional regulator [unclassified Micromonospora]MBU8859700.1 TetR family transcriptional regulator [Micromonospora sp. WMMB482]MDM4779216.1 TetR/AcrR family transcriptional regulator [Micromonospora sp. b486]
MTRRAAEIRLDALLRTACEVIAERGLANTRTADVAEAAGVSQALVFYHFATKDRLLAQAFAYAVEQDLARLDAVLRSSSPPLAKMRRMLRLYTPTGRATSWSMWIDGWAESLRTPELEKLSRRLDLRWRQDLAAVITAGVAEGTFDCPDPAGAAWRISAVMDGLAVQIAVHERVITRRQIAEWIRLVAARELGLEPSQLD